MKKHTQLKVDLMQAIKRDEERQQKLLNADLMQALITEASNEEEDEQVVEREVKAPVELPQGATALLAEPKAELPADNVEAQKPENEQAGQAEPGEENTDGNPLKGDDDQAA